MTYTQIQKRTQIKRCRTPAVYARLANSFDNIFTSGVLCLRPSAPSLLLGNEDSVVTCISKYHIFSLFFTGRRTWQPNPSLHTRTMCSRSSCPKGYNSTRAAQARSFRTRAWFQSENEHRADQLVFVHRAQNRIARYIM
jgi:hypothetical protein